MWLLTIQLNYHAYDQAFLSQGSSYKRRMVLETVQIERNHLKAFETNITALHNIFFDPMSYKIAPSKIKVFVDDLILVKCKRKMKTRVKSSLGFETMVSLSKQSHCWATTFTFSKNSFTLVCRWQLKEKRKNSHLPKFLNELVINNLT